MAEIAPIDGVDLDALRSWMDDRGLGSGDLVDVEALAGGTQNILVRFRRDDRTYVLRRPPVHKRKNSDDTMRREAQVLGAIANTEVPHPGLIAAEADTATLGAAFYLMEPIDGFNPSNGLPARHAADQSVRWKMGFALVDGAAALGAVDHTAVGLGDFGKPDGYIERQVPRWRGQLDSYTELCADWRPEIPGVDEVGEWLDANRPSDYRPGIIHGDYHTANVMYRNDGPQLAAIVDWELTTIGDPRIDLGLILAFRTTDPEEGHGDLLGAGLLDDFPTTAQLTARYAEQSARDVSSAAWFGVLSCYKTGIILEGTHARAMAGKTTKEFGDALHAITLSLFRRAQVLIASA